jgi:hypothetical protein
MAGTVKQIIGSFEDIGKDIVREAVQAPKDIVGKALESLGTSSQKGQKGNTITPGTTVTKQQEGALGDLDQVKDQQARQAIAREALAQIAGHSAKNKVPSVQEIHEKEKREKEEHEAKQSGTAQKMAPLVTGSSKPKRGNLYGVKQKSSSEMSKNVRQD